MSDDESPLAGTEVHYLRSAAGVEHKIFLGSCGSAEGGPVRVLYLTDANGYFGLTLDIVRSLQLARHLPSLLVVGVGYRAGGLGDTRPARTRDLTPTADSAYAALMPTERDMGGAAELLAFFRDELQPWVAARHDVTPRGTCYFGHSLGGLFGLYALLHEPSTFEGYVIGSPSLWWHGRVLFDFEEAAATCRADLPASVFCAIGADETQDGRIREAARLPADARALAAAWPIDMVDDLARFVDRLRSRAYPSLRLESVVLPGEFHVTAPPMILSRGLRWLFDAPS